MPQSPADCAIFDFFAEWSSCNHSNVKQCRNVTINLPYGKVVVEAETIPLVGQSADMIFRSVGDDKIADEDRW